MERVSGTDPNFFLSMMKFKQKKNKNKKKKKTKSYNVKYFYIAQKLT